MEETSILQELIKTVTLLDACHWIHADMKEIRASSVKKCIAKCHISETTHETDDEDSLPLAELLQLAKPDLTRPVTSAEEYVDIDNDVGNKSYWMIYRHHL